MKAIPLRFSLSAEFEQPDYVPTDFNLLLEREGRSQEVGNCWTYPTIFSFETDLIRKGLADQNIRGNEWSLSTLHANTLRGFDVSVKSDPVVSEDYYSFDGGGNWGGWHWYGLEYFATGKSGAMNSVSDRDVNRINNLLKNKLSGNFPNNRWYINQNLADSNLIPDPDQERLYGYDQAKIALSSEGVKKILVNDRIAGYLGYEIDASDELGFFKYLDSQSGSKGDKGEWFQPASFLFRDQEGSSYLLNDLLEAFKLDKLPRRDLFDELTDILSSGSGDGGGHAVTVVGWDDSFEPSIVNNTDEFFKTYVTKINDKLDEGLLDENQSELIQRLFSGFRQFLDLQGIEFTNRGDQSRGAWIIQNSWGNDSKQIERQYLPYGMADLSVNGEPLDKISTLYKGAMFHYADASRSFGNVQSASSAVPTSQLFTSESIDGRGVGFQFQSFGTPVVAIGSIVMAQPDDQGMYIDPKSKDLTYGTFVQAKLWDADQLLEKGFAKVDPLAETPLFPSFFGYQTLEFDAPVDLDQGKNIIATFEQYEDSSGRISNDTKDTFLSYKVNDIKMDKVQQIDNSGYTPSDPQFYENLPIPLVHPKSSAEIKKQTYFSISSGRNSASVLNDIGRSGEVIHLNVIHEKQQEFDDSFSNESDFFDILDDSKKGQISIGFSENRDSYKTPSKNLKETFFVNSSNNQIASGGKRDVFMMTESSGKKNLFDSGAGADTLILSLGPNNAFKGRLRLDSADDDLLIIRGQNVKSRLRSDKEGFFYDIKYSGARISAYVDNKNASLNIETDFVTDVTELLEIGV